MPELIAQNPSLQTVGAPAKQNEVHDKQGAPREPQVDVVAILYMYVFETTLSQERSTRIVTKQLETENEAQSNMIKVEHNFNIQVMQQDKMFQKVYLKDMTSEQFIVFMMMPDPNGADIHGVGANAWVELPVKGGQEYMEGVQSENQETVAIRSVFEDKISQEGQYVRVGQSRVGTDLDQVQMSVQQGDSIAKLLGALSDQVSKI